jgi:hypothetical protein
MKAKRRLVERTSNIHIKGVRKAGLTDDVAAIHIPGFSENVRLIWRDTPFGGRRAYFACPVCEAGAEILYVAPYLACRKCHNLAYRLENLTPLWRKQKKLHKLQRRAGCDISQWPRPVPSKPKWQRWHTYLALRRSIKEADHEFAAAYLRSRHGRFFRHRWWYPY